MDLGDTVSDMALSFNCTRRLLGPADATGLRLLLFHITGIKSSLQPSPPRLQAQGQPRQCILALIRSWLADGLGKVAQPNPARLELRGTKNFRESNDQRRESGRTQPTLPRESSVCPATPNNLQPRTTLQPEQEASQRRVPKGSAVLSGTSARMASCNRMPGLRNGGQYHSQQQLGLGHRPPAMRHPAKSCRFSWGRSTIGASPPPLGS